MATVVKDSMRNLIVYFLIILTFSDVSLSFKNITGDVFGDLTEGRIAAFGDFNSDRLIDVFVIKNGNRTVEILLANDKEPLLRPASLNCSIKDGIITSVVPGDYDGDSMMDLLVTVQRDDSQPKQINYFVVFWGHMNKLLCQDKYLGKMIGQPLVMDSNGDRIPDLFAVDDETGSRANWYFNKEFRNASKFLITLPTDVSNNTIRLPHSNTFIDLNQDMVADLLVTASNEYEIWHSVDGNLNFVERIPQPPQKKVGQSMLIDFDLDGKIEHLIPVCDGEECTNSTILLYENDNWVSVSSGFPPGWEFVQEAEGQINVRMGDYNMDGYPDCLVILRNKTQSKVLLLENVRKGGGRMLVNTGDYQPFNRIANPSVATFYDIFADGIMDIIVVSRFGDTFLMSAFRNEFSNDACFIKVMVLSGLCYSECESGVKPLGVNQPGPMICYKTTTITGDLQRSCAGQLSQSAYNSLQLPYVVFGLGQTPNFVDHLIVGIPSLPHSKEKRIHEWMSIIPNSQMIIIPQLKDSRVWMNKMYVTPSHLALKTFIALVGTCIFIAIIIAGLYWKERREDRKERLQAAHRFHFDAM